MHTPFLTFSNNLNLTLKEVKLKWKNWLAWTCNKNSRGGGGWVFLDCYDRIICGSKTCLTANKKQMWGHTSGHGNMVRRGREILVGAEK